MGLKEQQDAAIVIARMSRRGFVSLTGFSKLVGVSYPTALRLANNGHIRVIKVGGVKRVYAEEVQRFLTEGNLTPPSDL